MTNTTGHAPAAPGAPLATVATGGHHALVSAWLAKHYGGVVGSPLPQPIGTVTGVDHHSLVAAHLEAMRGRSSGTPAGSPAPTVTGRAHVAEVRALLIKYYGQGIGQDLADPAATVTARDRLGLVTVMVHGEPYFIADIGLRMLQPRELFRAQGFPDSYRINLEVDGRPLSKAAQVRAIPLREAAA